MKLLLGLLDSQQTDIIAAVIHTLSKILRSDKMKSSWSNFLELILLKILDCYKAHKDVCYQFNVQIEWGIEIFHEISHLQVATKIDEILTPLGHVLPVDATINILDPVIATGDFPTILCAIKLLTELVTFQREHITDAHVDKVMPNIAKVNTIFFQIAND